MREFYWVKRGTFAEKLKADAGLVGENGIVLFDKEGLMDQKKSFCRMMWDYPYYEIYSTGIKNASGEELMVYCRWDVAYELIAALREFVDKQSWNLKEGSGLESIQNHGSNAVIANSVWWCIDMPGKNRFTDWMAFFKPNEYFFRKGISNSFTVEWQSKTDEEKENEYRRALI